MTLNENTLTINIGDEVSFYEIFNDSGIENGHVDTKYHKSKAYITGKVIDVLVSDHLELFIKSEFSYHEVAAAQINRINNLFINLNNFRDNINFMCGGVVCGHKI